MNAPARYSIGSPDRGGRTRAPGVLVVDDERLVADTLSLIFQRAGFTAYTAYSAREALQLASLYTPDMLVSDVDMPGTSGVDLAMAMMERNPQCEVILFSGHAAVSDLARARAAGYEFPLLPKPVHPQVLLEAVSRRLGVAIPEELRIAAPGLHHESLTWEA